MYQLVNGITIQYLGLEGLQMSSYLGHLDLLSLLPRSDSMCQRERDIGSLWILMKHYTFIP